MEDKEVQILKIRSFDGGVLQIECHETVTSTASLAKRYANSGYPDRYMVFSRTQTESDVFGEKVADGQKSRGMFLSCILRPSLFPAQASLLRALSSVAMITALEEHTMKKLGIGWVSDIFCEKKKIGTVTLEGKLDDFRSYEYIIISFRLKTPKDVFPPRLEDMIRNVFENASDNTELIIAQKILAKFFPLYFNLKNQSRFMNIYKTKFIMREHRAKYIDKDKRLRCKIVNVDTTNGSLIVELKGGKRINVSSPANIILPRRIRLQK